MAPLRYMLRGYQPPVAQTTPDLSRPPAAAAAPVTPATASSLRRLNGSTERTSIDGLFGDAGRGRDAFDGQSGEASFDEKGVGRLQDGDAGLLAAPMAVAVVASVTRR
jgi:hypothetical protein